MNNPGHRIVCAAIKYPNEVIIAGVRHFDTIMVSAIQRNVLLGVIPSTEQLIRPEQGFLDNKYQYLTREEAWRVAEAAGQIIRRVGGDTANGGTLYSENLY